ncbi:MAG TPA: hypothetical protein VJ998_10425 [Pseudomonadales bacterium]|nr:hypothetical protein [Pseudomonadales bacterium]
MIRILFLAVVFAVVAPFFIKGPNGKPLMSLDKWMKPSPRSQAVTTPTGPEKRTIYKWQDKDGTWHFSTEPVEGQAVETMTVEGAVNVMPIAKTSTRATQPAKAEAPAEASAPGGLTTISPEKIKQTIEAAAHLQETVDQRKAQIDQVVEKQGGGN